MARKQKLSLKENPLIAVAMLLWLGSALLTVATMVRAASVPGIELGPMIVEAFLGLVLAALTLKLTWERRSLAKVAAAVRVAFWMWNPLAMMALGILYSSDALGGTLVGIREEVASTALLAFGADIVAFALALLPWAKRWWFVDPQNYWRVVMRQFGKRRLSMFGLYMVIAMMSLAVGADFLASDKPILMSYNGRIYVLANLVAYYDIRHETNQELADKFTDGDWAVFPPLPYGPNQDRVRGELTSHASPSALHPLGTDDRGRDVATRMVHGSRVSLAVGFVAVSIYTIVGVLLGSLAGFFGGRVDLLISRLIEVMLTFPTFFLILIIMGLLERITIVWMMLIIGVTRWPRMARLVRGEVIRVRSMDYVQAATSVGVAPARIIARHVLPNSIGPVLVAMTFGIAGAIIVEAALSFLGFGTPPPTATWGEILFQSFRYRADWWLALFPGLAIFISVTAYNIVGEGLRDAIDPQLREG